MGARRLTPGQAVEALREAIAIIREIWDLEGPPRVSHHGRYYDIDGAKRGPQPAHKIDIWVGAYKPRMIALTGEVGDGWLPTIEYLPNGAGSLAQLNAQIDESAIDAGRSPGDVRRLLNFMRVGISPVSRGLLDGPVDQWVDQLAALALEEGLSAFLIGGDDARVMATLGGEIAPAVRELVLRERGSGP
jgi:alkanesulfonate monooxygenase SsuD/methylene tetrahydromethanopterin reductase-like flavin-dependent oxidoreductase (luciferase family)